MNKNSKKNIFNKKNIVIGIMILIVIFVFVYFLFLRKLPEKKLSCEFSSGYGIKIQIDAYYTKPSAINRLNGIIEARLVSIEPFDNIADYASMMQAYYDDLVRGDSVNVKVSSENGLIFVKYDINYEDYKEGDLKSLDFLPKHENDEEFTVDSLKDSINSAGGVCVEE